MRPQTIPDALDDLATDRQMVLLKKGGEAQLNLLFSSFRNQLREMVQRRLDRRLLGRLDASDIIQETYLRAALAFDSYLKNPTLPPAIWLRVLAKQLVQEAHRKQFRAKRSPTLEQRFLEADNDPLAEMLYESMDSVGTRMAERELTLKIKDLISQLSALDREIIEMRHIDCLTIRESAQVMGVPLETAKKRYQRALTRFREIAEQLLPTE